VTSYRTAAIVGPRGEPVLIANTEPAYRNAGTGRRFVNFPGSNIGPNAALLSGLDMLRSRGRALLRNNPLVWNGMRRWVANVVGTGIQPQSDLPDSPRRDKIHDVWGDFVDQADADQLSDFYGQQVCAIREVFVAGEALIRLRARMPGDTDSAGLPLRVPLQCQLISGDQLPVWKNELLPNGGRIRAGIEFDQIGRRVAYWMYPQHPGDLFYGSSPTDIELRRVPAEQVIHLFEREEPGQIRGIPRLSRILLRAHDLDAYDDATVLRMNLAAMFALFVTSPDESAGPLSGMDGQPDDLVFEPGTIATLRPGEQITAAQPPDIGAHYADFVRAGHLMLAAGTGTTYEQLTGDLSRVNYSSIRAGLIEFRREIRSLIHTTIVPAFCRRVWVAFLRTAALAGAIELPEFATDPLGAVSACWIPQGFDWVDPQKETAAARDSVRAGFRTRRSVILEQGDVPADVEAEFAEEQKAARALNLVFDTDVTAVPAANPSTPRTELLTPGPTEPGQKPPAKQPQQAARGRNA